MGGFEQRPWTPTKRRGPIAAELSSPGPACVQLPQLLGKLKATILFLFYLFKFFRNKDTREQEGWCASF